MTALVYAEEDIVNAALKRIGGGSIFSLNDEGDLQEICRSIYYDTLDLALATFKWSFNWRTRALDQLSGAPENGWTYHHAFPADAIAGPRKLLTDPRNPDHPLRVFAIEGREIFSQHEKLWGLFPVRLTPDLWPPEFRVAFTVLLASALAVPVTHDASLKAALESEAGGTPSEYPRGGLLGRANANDVSATPGPAPMLASDPLTSARSDPLSGPWWR